jgi:hypothetical protein
LSIEVTIRGTGISDSPITWTVQVAGDDSYRDTSVGVTELNETPPQPQVPSSGGIFREVFHTDPCPAWGLWPLDREPTLPAGPAVWGDWTVSGFWKHLLTHDLRGLVTNTPSPVPIEWDQSPWFLVFSREVRKAPVAHGSNWPHNTRSAGCHPFRTPCPPPLPVFPGT